MIRRIPLFALLLLALAGSLPAGAPRILKDLPYKSGPALSAGERERCRLDLVLPEEAKGFPVLVWFHGGGLTQGTKDEPASRAAAQALASRGVGVVLANYRLYPGVKYPGYLDDAAAATAWVLAHAAEHGGDPRRVFVGGHSAGAYLAYMLAFEGRWLKAHGAAPDALRGIVPVSGQTFTHYTIRAERGMPDPEGTPVIDAGAPCFHAHAKVPPILAVCADGDHPDRRLENQYLMALLDTKGHQAHRYLEVPKRNHMSLVTELGRPGDPLATAIVDFLGLP